MSLTAKYIRFNLYPDSTRKTQMWLVEAIDGRIPLGHVSFFPRWRKYIFAPATGTLYEQQCLRDIAQFCEERTTEWRKGLNKEQA